MENIHSHDNTFQYNNKVQSMIYFYDMTFYNQSFSLTFYGFSPSLNWNTFSKLHSASYWPQKSINIELIQGNLERTVDKLQPPHKKTLI